MKGRKPICVKCGKRIEGVRVWTMDRILGKVCEHLTCPIKESIGFPEPTNAGDITLDKIISAYGL